ncbi:peroxisomal membrane protein 2-like [Macrosteles quadrilineatus]|uniref:peroxisomal membrane protein 2-like n=1 Tax=Macrosteles quadrilineatus TaxID=74068 RepID=UPI0023E11377|nr:peroxisomal membrane protein 2-like [Macrosteles quadrilineatus]
MSLSKPYKLAFTLFGAYYEGLYYNPIKTKSLTSSTIAMLANLTAQYMGGAKRLDQDSLIAFGLFGLLFGGSIPHFFYQMLDQVAPDSSSQYVIKQLLLERLIFTPLYQMFVIYMLARFESKTHQQAMSQLVQLYWPLLRANWTWITIPQLLNLTYVPPILRVLFSNLIGYVWTVFLAHKKRKADSRRNRLD